MYISVHLLWNTKLGCIVDKYDLSFQFSTLIKDESMPASKYFSLPSYSMYLLPPLSYPLIPNSVLSFSSDTIIIISFLFCCYRTIFH